MPADYHGSTLWRVSAFEELRDQPPAPGLERQTTLSSTLQAELGALERRREDSDPLEVIAACVRLQEPVLVYLRFDDTGLADHAVPVADALPLRPVR